MPKRIKVDPDTEAIRLPSEQVLLVQQALAEKDRNPAGSSAEEILERVRAQVRTWHPDQSA